VSGVVTTARAADTAAGVAVASASASWLADLSLWLQVTAAVVAIVAGLFAIAVHWKRLNGK